MTERVLIVDSAASFRRGLGATLDQIGYAVDEARSLDEWASARVPRVVIITIQTAAEIEELAARVSDGQSCVVALLTQPDPDLVTGALRSGIQCVVDRDASPEVMADAIRVGLSSHCVIPAWAAGLLAARLPSRPPSDQWIHDEEIQWLRLLAGGATVATLARRVGYSEREMFRNLNELYARIRVRNRMGALLWAERHGLLSLDIDQIPS